MTTKTLCLLIGPKGAGKTHIGRVIEYNLGISFIHAEQIWLDLPDGGDGWAAVEDAIDAELEQQDVAIVESLGAGDGFARMHSSLQQKYTVKYVRVTATPARCLDRVETRDRTNQIHLPLEKVAEYNAIAAAVELPWDAIVDNDAPATDVAILEAIRPVISGLSAV